MELIMKLLFAVYMLMALTGCSNKWFVPEKYSPELAYKCQTDPYGSYCLDPPAVLKN